MGVSEKVPTGNQAIELDSDSRGGMRVSWTGANRWRLSVSRENSLVSPAGVTIHYHAEFMAGHLGLSVAEARKLAAALEAAAAAAEAAPFYDETTDPEVR